MQVNPAIDPAIRAIDPPNIVTEAVTEALGGGQCGGVRSPSLGLIITDNKDKSNIERGRLVFTSAFTVEEYTLLYQTPYSRSEQFKGKNSPIKRKR